MAEPSLAKRFLAIGAAGALIAGIGVALLAWPEPAAGGKAAGLAASAAALAALAVAGVAHSLWRLASRRAAAAAARLAEETRLIARANRAHRIAAQDYPDAPGLPLAINELAERLAAQSKETAAAVAAATAQTEEQKRRLEAILRDLSEGVVVCNLNHEILLYNAAALSVLSMAGEIGLARSLFATVTREPILHALDLLESRPRKPGATHPSETTVPVVCASTDGTRLLQGRISLVLDAAGAATGYVLTLADATREFAALRDYDALLFAATDGLRQPLANLRAAVETVAAHPDMGGQDRAAFDRVIARETQVLAAEIEKTAAARRDRVLGAWPLYDIHSTDLFTCVLRRLAKTGGPRLTETGLPVWLRGDSFSLMLALETLIGRLAATGAAAIDLSAEREASRAVIELEWTGAPIASAELDRWLAEPLGGASGALTLREIVDRHQAEIWSRAAPRGRAVLRLPLLAAESPAAAAAPPARPEFYDFSLLQRQVADKRTGDRPLREQTIVVFDTETTGLKPAQGDEIVSIAGVRIVNGRLLTGETFERIVNPGRRIPAEATKFHGLTDADVADKPPLNVVLPQFKAFVGDAVLVAHNAAFDMTFVQRGAAGAGLAFDNTVLDSLLLASFLQPDLDDHSLDALAQRFGVEIGRRHGALSDAMATAAIFLRLAELLEGRGIVTLNQALEATNMQARLRAGERTWKGAA